MFSYLPLEDGKANWNHNVGVLFVRNALKGNETGLGLIEFVLSSSGYEGFGRGKPEFAEVTAGVAGEDLLHYDR